MERIVVTLDGPAGVGKSSMARELSEALAIPYLDTGAMFRAVAWKLGEGSWDWDEERLRAALKDVSFELHGSGGSSGLSLNGALIGDEIRSERVGMWASNVARLPVVREYMKAAQRAIGERSSLVAEGRDMGSVVFPRATVKFFLDADVRERARRRYEQLREMNEPADMDDLAESIRARDEQDRNRAVAPLRPAEDAVLVDTTHINKEQVAALLLSAVRERVGG
ncbi:(d)CMP kinase [Paucidesulfovibrio longus]|uniref:(d)CMP kinase n=1 Tax=Paucidesulfovibrio longus TaxID=889 RepID=UPI0003B541EE|nr:(d)CMP kinase [Paucidesulfovibrio longus]